MFTESKKIPLIFSGITIGMVIIAGIVFYFMFSSYTKSLYYNYLSEKAHIVAMEEFEKDELDSIGYQNVIQRRKTSIPTSKEIIINLNDTLRSHQIFREYLTEEEIKTFYKNLNLNFTNGEEVGTIITYYDNSGTYAVLILSSNPYGEKIDSVIRWAMLTLVIIASIVLYLISRLYAIRIVDQIKNDYQTEKLFVNNASHEISNPLTAIQGECEIALLRSRQPEEYKKTLERIARETERIIVIMGRLLKFSHTRSEEIDPNTLELVRISDFLKPYSSEQVEIQIISDFSILIREDLLKIAINNIVSNAQKYSKNNKVLISVNHDTVTVKDFGIGISPEDIQHIFEPFYRAKNADSFEGHGVGLSLSKTIIEKFGGKIHVESELGKGTTFTITFKKYLR